MKFRKSPANALGIVLTLALLVFSYKYISDLVAQTQDISFDVNWPLAGLSSLLFIIFYVILSIHWLWACRVVDRDVPKNQLSAFMASQPYKYLPTSIFTFSYRAFYAKRNGLGIKKSSAAQVIENASMLTANFSLFMVTYLFQANRMILGFFILVGLMGTILFSSKKYIILRLKGRMLRMSTSLLIKMFILALAGWLVSGASFVMLNMALGASVSVVALVAANSLAFSLGLLAFFAPGGIGVRELIYNNFGVNPIAIIYWRILTFVLDIVLGVVAIFVIYRSSERKA